MNEFLLIWGVIIVILIWQAVAGIMINRLSVRIEALEQNIKPLENDLK